MARKRPTPPQQSQVEAFAQKAVIWLTLLAGFVVAVDQLVGVLAKLLALL
jgi:hypothetical protein